MDRTDAGAEICNLQNFGFVNGAKECAQELLLFCGVTERGSLKIDLMIKPGSEKDNPPRG
jgi:hypothetical protein